MLLAVWAAVGVGGIVANIGAALHAERLAHRNRLIADEPLLRPRARPAARRFTARRHSGRMMKVMLTGADAMFGLWLTFFREQLSTVVATVVLLPLDDVPELAPGDLADRAAGAVLCV